MGTEKLYYTIAEICDRYSISRTTLWRLSKLEECPPFMKLCGGGKTLIPAAAFDAFFRSQLTETVLTENRRKEQAG